MPPLLKPFFQKQAVLLTMLLLLNLLNPVFANEPAPRRIIYTGNPVKVTLGVNTEQRITFPDAKIVFAKIKDKLGGKLTAQIVNNDVFLLAKDAFKEERIIIGEEGGSKVYLIDIVGLQKKVANRRILVVDGEDRYAMSAQKKAEPEAVIAPLKQPRQSRSPVAGYVTLLRCAAKQVYAPDRLRKCPVGIHKAFVNTRFVQNLMRYHQATTQPVAAWRSGGVYITAIRVVNRTQGRINLDPRRLRGTWKAALFYRGYLTRSGTSRDNTTLFLVSKAPFEDAVRSSAMIKTARGR